MEPAPLLDPAPGSAAHAALAAFALASAGRRDEARELAARESVRFPGEAATPMLAEVEKFLAGPAPDVPAFVEKVFRPALEDLLRGAERWDVVVRPGGGRDVEVRIFLDFPQEEWRLSLKSEGKSAAVFHGKGARVRFWVAGEARIFDVPGGFLPAVRIDLAQAESGTRATDFRSEALPWTEIGKVNAALRRNPLLTTPEGITRLLTRSPRVVLVAAEHGDGDACSFTWGWPDRREPKWSTLRAEFSKGRLAALRSGDAELTLRYGGADDVATPDLVWPEVPVMQREDVPAGQILQVLGRLVQRLGVGQPAWK
jgi:hypothetical protein